MSFPSSSSSTLVVSISSVPFLWSLSLTFILLSSLNNQNTLDAKIKERPKPEELIKEGILSSESRARTRSSLLPFPSLQACLSSS